jgi:hypothetical protein
MVTPSRALAGARPVDHLKGGPAPLLRALETFHWVLGAVALRQISAESSTALKDDTVACFRTRSSNVSFVR